MRRRAIVALLVGAVLLVAAVAATSGGAVRRAWDAVAPSHSAGPRVADRASEKAHRAAHAAEGQVGRTVRYDAAYVELAYPGGDVPADRGVCTDVVVRAFREVGVDLQVAVHEDMSRTFRAYPRLWKLDHPDASIDHRRVPNLQTYFTRKGKARAVTSSAEEYQPGDVVVWRVYGGLHMGMVSTRRSDDGQRFLVAHNMGAGTRVEDRLFEWRIVGHYRAF